MRPDSALGDSGARRLAGRLIGASIVAGAAIAVVVTLLQWETRPQTDDATVRANFVGIAPQVSGHIIDLRVHDNQFVREGDLRSEEHTSELQSLAYLVCRLLLEKKKKYNTQ